MTKQKKITDLIPNDWFKNKEKSSIWITAYRIMFANKEKLKIEQIYDFSNIRAILIYGKLQYLDTSNIKPEIDNNGNVKLDARVNNSMTPEGGWLIILQPYIIDGIEIPEYKIRVNAGVYAALFSVINGRNMAFERVFDNRISVKDSQTSASSPSFINPGVFPIPDVSKERCESIHKAGLLIQAKPENIRRRIELSLHWFEKGMRTTSGLDGFINYWVAIETIGMPDTTNIRPLNQTLADAYNISLEEATEKFGIGKVFGFRSRILHNGEDLPVHQLLSEYMESIYVDILLQYLKMPPENKTLKVINRSDFDLDRLVHINT